MTEYYPVFWDIETTGFNPTVPTWWSKPAAEVTAVAIGQIKDWDGDGEDRSVQVHMNRGNEEYELIENIREAMIDFEDRLEEKGMEPYLVGHNIRGFDVLYWSARAARYRQDPYPFGYGWKRLDTLRALELPSDHGVEDVSNRKYPGQQDYADYLGIDYLDELDGSDMPQAFIDGEYQKIENHVRDDIEVAMEIFMQERDVMMDEFWGHYDDRLDGDKPTFTETVEIEYNGDN